MELPCSFAPIIELPVMKKVKLFLKREDQLDAEITGNKFWKLFYPIKTVLDREGPKPLFYTFGGAYSNHVAAFSALGKRYGFSTHGIIRGEELAQSWHQNPTLRLAAENGMEFSFVSREVYREKAQIERLVKAFASSAVLIPEGGTSPLAVQGLQHMLSPDTQIFDYLCAPVGTGGTLAGLSKYAGPKQRVLGFKVVRDASLEKKIELLSGRSNFDLIEASEGGYGKMAPELIEFINRFSKQYSVPLDPIYTGKLMRKLFELIELDYFPEGSRILVIHTGGLQGIQGANDWLESKARPLIDLLPRAQILE